MFAETHPVDPDKISGKRNGYSYQLMGSPGTGLLSYLINTPDKTSFICNVDSEGQMAMIADVEIFIKSIEN